MIFTASYFCPQNHHGKLISISRSNPKQFTRIPKLQFFSPSKDLLAWWKKSAQTDTDWENYQDRFFAQIDNDWVRISHWLDKDHSTGDITLLCWEKPGEYCHRNDVGDIIAARLPEFFGGKDVPHSFIEKQVLACNKKGLPVRCNRITYTKEQCDLFDGGFTLYKLWLGKKELCLDTETGTRNILGQLLNPTYSTKWFEGYGLGSQELELIGHRSFKK